MDEQKKYSQSDLTIADILQASFYWASASEMCSEYIY